MLNARCCMLNASYPCLCLCLGLEQMTKITPLRRTMRHLLQIFFTDALTFISLGTKNVARHFCRAINKTKVRLTILGGFIKHNS
jgi:hypothetical protein